MSNVLDEAAQLRSHYLLWLQSQTDDIAQNTLTRIRVESRNFAAGMQREIAPVLRVEQALQASGERATQLVVAGYQDLKFDEMVLRILVGLAKDIALYGGGSVVVGAGIGAVVGAVPGAVVGGAVGLAVAPWVLAMIGLKCLAEDLIKTLPDALRRYQHGFKAAWQSNTQFEAFQIRSAAEEFAQGHLLLITALLMAIAAYLLKGSLNKGKLLAEIRRSSRLGPEVAGWVEKNEAGLLKSGGRLKPKLMQKVEAQTATAETPSQAAGRKSGNGNNRDVETSTLKRVPPQRRPNLRQNLKEKWFDPETGKLKWPDGTETDPINGSKTLPDGFSNSPMKQVLEPGTIIDRYGPPSGNFLSPAGTPFEARALPYDQSIVKISQYKVLKALPVDSGTARQWFDQVGGGTQYKTPKSVSELINEGYLEAVGP